MNDTAASLFTQGLTKALKTTKATIRCQVCVDESICVSDGRFIVRLTAKEYDALVRPAVKEDPGDWALDKKSGKQPDASIDLAVILNSPAEPAVYDMQDAPMTLRSKSDHKRELIGCWNSQNGFISMFDAAYFNMITPGLSKKTAGPGKPLLFLDDASRPVMCVLPVVTQDESVHRAVKAYFTPEPVSGENDIAPQTESPRNPAAPQTQAAPAHVRNQTRPLADAMRPVNLDEIVGQDHITGPGTLLRNMVERGNLMSVILYGPPGTGKTTIAEAIANSVDAEFLRLNATTSGKKQIEQACERAGQLLQSGKRTVLFIDEIHRFNKAQQDFLLPFVENGTVILVGATTENPYFEVNPALNSRAAILELKPIGADDMLSLLYRAMFDPDRGLASRGQSLSTDAAVLITDVSGGDARFALNMLDLSSRISEAMDGPGKEITAEHARQAAQRPNLRYDRDGDVHYDILSAFIKSMRGSDPDAVLYYLARMLESGEDPKVVARRIVVAASEDVGCADPMALQVATCAFLATERVGLPEASIILAQAALHVALAPKSNTAYKGISAAMDYVRQHPLSQVPPPLQDAHYKSARKLGRGIGYEYPHDYVNHFCAQRYLPEDVPAGLFYTASGMGYEQSQLQFQQALGHPVQYEDVSVKKRQQGS